MNEESFNLSIRKFLKMVGVNSQREIEQAVARAIAGETNGANGGSGATGSLPATMTLEIPALNLSVRFDGEISIG